MLTEKITAILFVLVWLSLFLHLLYQARKANRLSEHQKFYRAIKPRDRRKKDLTFWLPLFLYRRRRPVCKPRFRISSKMVRV